MSTSPSHRRNPLLGPDAAAPDSADADADTQGRTNTTDPGTSRPDPAATDATSDIDRTPSSAATPSDEPGGSRRTPGSARSSEGRNLSRRIDPTGKHALFSTPPTAAPDQLRAGSRETGRSAFYSTGSRQSGTVIVECSACTTRTRVTLVDLGLRFLSISAWIPGRRHSHWMRCPACHDHTWCRVGWTD